MLHVLVAQEAKMVHGAPGSLYPAAKQVCVTPEGLRYWGRHQNLRYQESFHIKSRLKREEKFEDRRTREGRGGEIKEKNGRLISERVRCR
jgi:hypothetical protein